MLDRPSGRRPSPGARRAARRAQQRRYRALQRAGERIASVRYGSDDVDKLIRLGFLLEDRADDRRAVAEAIALLLAHVEP